MQERIGILFVQSPDQLAADGFIHLQLMRSLDRSRFDVHVACSPGPPGKTTGIYRTLSAVPNLHVKPTNFGRSVYGTSLRQKAGSALVQFQSILSLASLAFYMRRKRIRVVHASTRPRDALACILLARLGGAKSVIHLHVASGTWTSRPVRWAIGQADVLFSISSYVTRSLLHSSYQKAKIRQLLNAIDTKNWDYELSAQSAREELGLAQNVPVIVCIGRLFPAKGQRDLIRALPAVQQCWPDVKVLIVGAYDRSASRGASYSDELAQLVRELGLEANVSFLGYRPDVARVLAAADVFCLPSFEEPFGLVFLEAMAMKKPVVALNNGGTPEVVVHGQTGLLSEPGDIDALARNLITLVGNPALRTQMGNHGRTLVEERFDMSRMARDAELLYEELIRGEELG